MAWTMLTTLPALASAASYSSRSSPTASPTSIRRRNGTRRILSEARRALSHREGERQPVPRRCEGTRPARVERARWVVRKVEVDDQPVAVDTEVGALDRVEHVATAPVGLGATRRVGD